MKILALLFFFVLFQLAIAVMDQSMYIKNYYNMQHIQSHFKDKYLKQTDKMFQQHHKGYMWGPNRQLLISLPVKLQNNNCTAKINVIFKVDSGTGQTYLSDSVLYELYSICGKDPIYQKQHFIEINQKNDISFSKKYKYETNLSVLGSKFLHRHHVKLIANYSQENNESFQLIFKNEKNLQL